MSQSILPYFSATCHKSRTGSKFHSNLGGLRLFRLPVEVRRQVQQLPLGFLQRRRQLLNFLEQVGVGLTQLCIRRVRKLEPAKSGLVLSFTVE